MRTEGEKKPQRLRKLFLFLLQTHNLDFNTEGRETSDTPEHDIVAQVSGFFCLSHFFYHCFYIHGLKAVTKKKINKSQSFLPKPGDQEKSYKKEWNKLRGTNKEFLGKREKANMNVVLVVLTLKLSLMEVDTRPKKIEKSLLFFKPSTHWEYQYTLPLWISNKENVIYLGFNWSMYFQNCQNRVTSFPLSKPSLISFCIYFVKEIQMQIWTNS